ncbi:MAG TPA: lycopene cyclase domain-containing protein [Mycobacteriales bacterium]
MTYTDLAVAAVAITVGLDLLVLRTRLLRSRRFWVAYAIVLAFQLIVNGVLTGRRVVVYDGADIIGTSASPFIGAGRFCFAPVEDLLFGFSLVTQTLCWWVWWGRRVEP